RSVRKFILYRHSKKFLCLLFVLIVKLNKAIKNKQEQSNYLYTPVSYRTKQALYLLVDEALSKVVYPQPLLITCGKLKKSVYNQFVMDLWITDRKSTRLNSSHVKISYAVFCLKKKKRYKNHLIVNFCIR